MESIEKPKQKNQFRETIKKTKKQTKKLIKQKKRDHEKYEERNRNYKCSIVVKMKNIY
jgi:ribosomal protein L4